MSKKSGLKFMIVGLGSIGRRHMQNLRALGQEDIIIFRTGKGTIKDANQGFPVFSDLSSAFDEKPDAVIISNPTALHMPVAEIAAKNGVHIILEKPISHTIDSLQKFENILAASSSRVLVAYQFRFNAGLRKIDELLKQKDLGKPLSFLCRWGEYLPDWHPWEDYRMSYAARSEMGGGVVLTLSHPIDYLRWLFGDVTELVSETGNQSKLDLECEDFADVEMVFESGVAGRLHLDYYSKPKMHDLKIVCENGSISWDYATNEVTIAPNKGEPGIFSPPAEYDRNQMYLDEMAHFIEMIETDSKPICSYQDGKQALQIALGILQSGRYQDKALFKK